MRARPTVLVVPPEFKAKLNRTSLFLTGPYRHKSLKGLFLSPENVKYIAGEIYACCTYIPFIKAHMNSILADNTEYNIVGASDDVDQRVDGSIVAPGFAELDLDTQDRQARRIARGMQANKQMFYEMAPNWLRIADEPLNRDYYEDMTIPNPIVQLHYQNLDVIQQTARNIIAVPTQIDPSLDWFNPETGRMENLDAMKGGSAVAGEYSAQYDYNTASWQNGWCPEHLFTNSERNRANPYWVPLQVDLNVESGHRARQAGHRYDSPVYGVDPVIAERSGLAFSSSQFPRPNYSGLDRSGLSRTAEGYREAAEGDRRVQGSHGFNMSALTGKSYY